MVKKYKIILFLFAFLINATAVSYSQKPSQKVIKKILAAISNQEKSWNNGSIKDYMNYYYNSDSLQFITKLGITYGWQTTLDNYLKTFPDKQTMGILYFSDIKLTRIDSKTVVVSAKWQLQRENDSPGGWFTQIWKKTKGKWLIIIDHTS